MKTSVLLIPFFFCLLSAAAQKQERVFKDKRGHHHKLGNINSRAALFINPLGPAEIQEAAVGLGVNIKLQRRWDISLELDYLYRGWIEESYSKQVHNGLRGIFTVKRFSDSRVFFYGLDTRLKYYGFSDVQSYLNPTLPDTLFNVRFNASTLVAGAGGIAGLRLPLSKNRKWAIELTAGVGVKYRWVYRKNLPPGYKIWEDPSFIRKDFNYQTGQSINGWSMYAPWSVKFMYFF